MLFESLICVLLLPQTIPLREKGKSVASRTHVPPGAPPCHLPKARSQLPHPELPALRLETVLYAIRWDVVHSQWVGLFEESRYGRGDFSVFYECLWKLLRVKNNCDLNWAWDLNWFLSFYRSGKSRRQRFSPLHTHVSSQLGLFSVPVNNTGAVFLAEVWPSESPSYFPC